MNKLTPYPVCAYLLLLAACAGEPQDIPPGFTEDPAFFADLVLDGEEIKISAGIDSYVLTPRHEVADGVALYEARLHPESCTSECPGSIAFRFWGSADSSGSNYAHTFTTGPKGFYQREEQTIVLEFGVNDAFNGLDGAAYWTGAGVDNPGNVVFMQSAMEDIVNICYHSAVGISGSNRCLSSHCFEMQAMSPCLGWLKAEKVYGTNVLVEPVLVGEGPYTFSWMNGATSPFILLPMTANVTRGVQVTIESAEGCVIEINQTLNLTGGVPQLCPPDPGFFIDSYPALFDQFNTVQIEYVDRNGVRFSSSDGLQDQAVFDLLEAEPFLQSPQGFPTIKLQGVLRCTLYSDDGQATVPLTSEFVIAVSHDE